MARTGRPPASPETKAVSARLAAVLGEYFDYRTLNKSKRGKFRYAAKRMSAEMAELLPNCWTPGWSTIHNARVGAKNSFSPRVINAIEQFFMARGELVFLLKLKQSLEPQAGDSLGSVGYATHLASKSRQAQHAKNTSATGKEDLWTT